MQYTPLRFHAVSLLLPVFLLTACGGAPTDTDIKTALDRANEESSKAIAKMGMGSLMKGMQAEFKDVKKIGCKADGEHAYICDVEYVVTQLGNTSKQTVPMRFAKGSEGWVLTK